MRKNNKDYSITEEKFEIIKKHIEKIDKIKNDLQKHINFEIPEYIIHDIAENEEFNHIFVLNLRGAIRQKSGDLAKKEGGNIFDIMTGVAIVLLVKDGTQLHEIFYHNIGDYLAKNKKFQ